MGPASQFAAIVVPVDFAEAPGDASDDAGTGFIAAVGEQRVAFSPGTVRAFETAVALARTNAAKLHLVHAVPPMHGVGIYTGPVNVPAAIVDEIHERAKVASVAAMTALVTERGGGIAAQLSVAPSKALPYVLDRARAVDADLIVMAASGRSRVARFFVGSTADRIIRESICPVLVLPADHD